MNKWTHNVPQGIANSELVYVTSRFWVASFTFAPFKWWNTRVQKYKNACCYDF